MSGRQQNLSTSCLVTSPFDEDLIGEAARACLAELGSAPDLVLAFVSSDYQDSLPRFLESLAIDGHATKIAGGSACGLVGVGQELENVSGFSLLFLKLPSTQVAIGRDAPSSPVDASLLLANPNHVTLEETLEDWNDKDIPSPLIGGCVTGGPGEEDLFLFNQDGKTSSAGLFIHLAGGVRIVPLLAPGCRPIGEPLIVTGAAGSEVLSLAQQEPFDVLEKAFEGLGSELQLEAGGHIFAGLAINEEKSDFDSGDFHVQQIVGATLHDGRLQLEAPARVGQTLQFLWRDPLAAEMQLRNACEKVFEDEGAPFAATLFAGKGRGKALFGVEDRNVSTFEDVFGKLPLTGLHSFREFGATSPDLLPQSHSVCGALFYPESKSTGNRE